MALLSEGRITLKQHKLVGEVCFRSLQRMSWLYFTQKQYWFDFIDKIYSFSSHTLTKMNPYIIGGEAYTFFVDITLDSIFNSPSIWEKFKKQTFRGLDHYLIKHWIDHLDRIAQKIAAILSEN